MAYFVAGDKAHDFNRMSRAERKAQCLKELSHRFGADAEGLSERILFPAISPQKTQSRTHISSSTGRWTSGRAGISQAAWDQESGPALDSARLYVSRLDGFTGLASIRPRTHTTLSAVPRNRENGPHERRSRRTDQPWGSIGQALQPNRVLEFCMILSPGVVRDLLSRRAAA